MDVILLFFGLLLFVAFLAIYGFVALVNKLFARPEATPPQTRRAEGTLQDDVAASARLLNYLYEQGQIGDQQYRRLRNLLDERFGDGMVLPSRLLQPTTRRAPPIADEPAVPLPSGAEVVDLATRETREPVAGKKEQIADEEIVFAELVEHHAPSHPMESAQVIQPADITTEEIKPEPVATSRVSAVESPTIAAKQRLADILAAFMQEKNIRWGELASGILIVGSAIGLVVSLRNELNDTIPYFPALLFMLITAAIHGAGSYTLNKWKLRNTSRGTLLIGLLLVPLNFLAACILTGSEQLRRPLDDPAYWIAVVTGVVSFGFMTWWSSRLLLRRGNLPLTIGIMGAAMLTLVINRFEFPGSSSWLAFALAVAVAAFALTGSGVLIPSAWKRKTLSRRTVNRLFMTLGLSVFAFAAAVSLIIIRASDNHQALVAITPAITVVAMVVAACGGMVQMRARGGEEANSRIVGLSLLVLGLILAAGSLVISTSNPTLLLINGLVAAAPIWMVARVQKLPALIPFAWASLAVSVLCTVSLVAGSVEFDSQASWNELFRALVSGSSGLSLLALGTAITGLHFLARRPDAASLDTPGYAGSMLNHHINLLSAGSLAGFGCLLALAAGLLHRSNVFETMTASVLLLLASIVLLILAVRTRIDGLPLAASGTLLGCLVFSFLWNPTTSAWIEPLSRGLSANWLFVFVGTALITGIAAALSARVVKDNEVSRTTRQLGICAAIPAVIATFGSLVYAGSGTGFSTFIIVLTMIAWFCIAWSHRNDGGNSLNFSISFALSTGLLIAVAVFEFASELGLPPSPGVSHWLTQLILLAAWSTLWSVSAVFLGRFRMIAWIFTNQRVRGDQIVLAASVVAILLLVGLPLVEAAGRELSASYASFFKPVNDFLALAWWSILAALIAVAASAFYRGNLIKGVEFAGLYLLAWCLVAAPFDQSRSVASAIRWLVPIGALVASGSSFLSASLSHQWNRARQRCGLIESDARSSGIGSKLAMNETGTQLLTNLFLFASIVIVLAISSIATAQVLLTEAGTDALGGPIQSSWFGRLRAEINYGIPGAVLTASVLLFAISQRRGWLAVAGSAVYQYVVIFSLVMLVFSVHPALATKRFVETLLAVSLGMTGYGFVWYWQRHRIGDAASVVLTRKLSVRQIEFHTIINCALVTSLAVLIGWRFFFRPDEAGGWINTAGGPLGIAALVAVVALAYLVWRERVAAESNANLISCLCCWTGLVLTAMVAAIVDRASGGGQWIGFRVILWGSTVVSTALIGIALFYRRNSRSVISAFPAVAAALVAVLFAMRGGWSHPTAFAQYMMAIGLVAVLTSLIGWVVRDARPSVISAVSWLLAAYTLTTVDPAQVFANGVIDFINLGFAGLIALSLAWTGFYIWRRAKREMLRSEFALLPNTVLLGASIWVLLGSLCEWAIRSGTGLLVGDHALAYSWGIVTVAGTAVLSAVHLWNDRNSVRVASPWLCSMGVVILVVVVVARQPATRFVWAMFAVSLLSAIWGIIWAQRERCLQVARSLKIPRPGQLRESMRIQLPVFSLSVGLVLMLATVFSMIETEDRLLRLLTAMTPLFVAISVACQSNGRERRWMQHLSLGLVTIGFVFTAWNDLVPSATFLNSLQLAIRALLVLAGAVLVYGILIAKWVREETGWLKTLREMTVATCACAFICLAVVVGLESRSFVEGVGCGLSVAESVAATLVITGMIAGLVVIAVRPANDPFSLSLKGRMAYVYAAELMVILLVAHLYFSMPWLFQLGIRQYWPYIAMLLAFGGVWIAQILEQRNLTVLGEPIFHTAAMLPVLVSALIWAVDSRADASLVLLMAGLAYLLISYTHQSALSGAAAIILGNLALWVFYGRFPNFSFFDHPQLWLIPPAVSVLIAGHLAGNSLSRQQLALLRYLCVAVIYISSTFEIFISGIGDQLWPPIVLAVISLLGIMLGMIFQVRAYLFLGSLFLLLAMITMVAHAHQSLNHVWPWWAFGIGMGVAILVMFGLFESRKHKIKAITGELQKWDL